MDTPEKNSGNRGDTGRSRFAYHGDEPEEGGVTSVASKAARQNGAGQGQGHGRPASPGVPGPEERLLDISELVRNVGMHYVHRFRIPAGEVPDLPTAEPTVGQITLTNAGALLLLKGQAETTLQLECGRCLKPTTAPVHADLEEAFPLVTTNNAYQQEEVQAVDEDAPAAVIKGNILDLGDLLRQELSLAAPLQPLCQEDCPGLLGGDIVTLEPEYPAEPEPEVAADNPLKKLGALWAARESGQPETE